MTQYTKQGNIKQVNGLLLRTSETGNGGQARNAISLDIDAVHSLLDESEGFLSLTLNDIDVPVLQIIGDDRDSVTLTDAIEISHLEMEGKLYQFNGDSSVYVQVISANGALGYLPVIDMPVA